MADAAFLLECANSVYSTAAFLLECANCMYSTAAYHYCKTSDISGRQLSVCLMIIIIIERLLERFKSTRNARVMQTRNAARFGYGAFLFLLFFAGVVAVHPGLPPCQCVTEAKGTLEVLVLCRYRTRQWTREAGYRVVLHPHRTRGIRIRTRQVLGTGG
jgi:hypothetical protein